MFSFSSFKYIWETLTNHNDLLWNLEKNNNLFLIVEKHPDLLRLTVDMTHKDNMLWIVKKKKRPKKTLRCSHIQKLSFQKASKVALISYL